MTTSTLTRRNQTTIPREVRERLGLRPGDRLAYEVRGNGEVVLKPGETAGDVAGSLRGRIDPGRLDATDEDLHAAAAETWGERWRRGGGAGDDANGAAA